MIIQDGGAQESARAGWLLSSPQTSNSKHMGFQLASSFSLAANQREGASTKAGENTLKVEDAGGRLYRQIWYSYLQHKTLLLVSWVPSKCIRKL